MRATAIKSYESDIGEPIRSLVQRLNLASQGKPARVIAFIAARPREGTSTVATAYAQALASESSQKILLIDAGPLSVKRFEALDIDPTVGIVDTMIAGKLPKQAIYPVGKDVAFGRWIGSKENRSAATRMMNNPDFWQAQLGSFDSLIIDAPSLQNSFDGVMLAAKADATVIVTESEKTPQAVVQHLRQTLVAAGANIAGVVLNKRRYYIPKRAYKKL